MQTHANYLAAATAFNGTKGGHLEKFMATLQAPADEAATETRTMTIADLAAMGRKILTVEASDADETKRLEREAEQAAMVALFEKHRPSVA